MALSGLIGICWSGFATAEDWPDRLVGHGGPIKSVTVSATSAEALTGSFDYAVVHWDLTGSDGTVRKRLIGHDAAVNDVEFLPASDRAISVSDDGTAIVWDLEAGEVAERFDAGGRKVLDVAVSSDGRYAAAAGWDKSVRLWDLETLTEKAALTGHRAIVNTVTFSEDGERLFSASYDGIVRMWDTETGRFEREIYRHGWGVNVVRALPGGSHLLIGATDGVARVVFIETGEVIVDLPQHDGPVLAAAVNEEAGLAAVGAGDGLIRVYSLAGWAMEEEHENAFGPVWGLAFADDGQRLYHVGLDDFAIGWQVSPRKSFEPVLSSYPRRFQTSGDMDPGERQFARKCSVCHTLSGDDANRAGPTLQDLFGRKAGTLPGYPYSRALLDSDIIWSSETIRRLFDDGPDIVTPGTKMPVQRLKKPGELDALIAYLERATVAQSEQREEK